jgi:PhoPQ-activated pathogenicity-related protein
MFPSNGMKSTKEMKTKILALTLTSAMVAASLITFAQEDKKVKEAQKDLWKRIKTWKKRKRIRPLETTIRENQMQIATLKAKKSTDTKEVKESYDKRVVTLEQKNNNLKMKISGSSQVKTSEWSSFKRDFNHDMDELGQAIKDVGTDGTK